MPTEMRPCESFTKRPDMEVVTKARVVSLHQLHCNFIVLTSLSWSVGWTGGTAEVLEVTPILVRFRPITCVWNRTADIVVIEF
jgi:hypothetical protein